MTKPTEVVRVMGFFAVMIFVNAGGFSSACKRVEAIRGEKVTLLDEKSGLKYVNKVKLYEAWSNCEARTREEIIIYCSSKEKGFGCKAKNSSTFLLQIENNSVSLTPLDACEAGCYVVEITGNTVVKKLVAVKGSLDTAKAWTISLEQLCIIAAGIAVFTAVVILAVIGVISCICQKTQSDADADAGDPDETTSVISTTSGGKDDTNDSYEMVDKSRFCLVDMGKKKLGDNFLFDSIYVYNNSNGSNNNSQKKYSNN